MRSTTIPTDRHEVVDYVAALLRSATITDQEYSVAVALMTRYAIDAAEINAR